MGVIPSILNRRSVRKYSDRPVEPELILQCIEAARLAPSAENSQPWRFIVIEDPAFRAQFDKRVFNGIYAPTRFAVKAPALVALCAELDILANRLGRVIQGMPFYLMDVGMAGEHFVLQAAEMGLGTCWIGWFDYRRARKLLKLPRKIRLCALIAVGYPPEGYEARPNKRDALESLVYYDAWGKSKS